MSPKNNLKLDIMLQICKIVTHNMLLIATGRLRLPSYQHTLKLFFNDILNKQYIFGTLH